MADQRFVKEMVQDTRDKEWTDAAMRFTEEFTLVGPADMARALFPLNKELRDNGLPALRISLDSRGQLNGVYGDQAPQIKPLYSKPADRDNALQDEELERLAQHLEAVKELESFPSSSGLDIGRAEIKRAANFILDESLKLDKADQNAVLRRASEVSYKHGHSLNVVFADLNGDGKRDELSDVSVNYIAKPSQTVERIDLYDPPRK